jgi:hypothetical protein
VTIYVILGTLLVGIVYFAAAATSPGLGLLMSPIVGLLGFGFFRLIDPGERGRAGHLRVLCATGVGSGLGAGLNMALGLHENSAWDWAGVVVCVVIGSATYTLSGRSTSEPCSLCKMKVAGGGVHCPRCGDWVCPRPTCWNAKYARCVRCHAREIVIFPIVEKWWDARLGRRVMKGECSSCYKEAHEANLRECGQCHWPMCQRCWDYYNGSCQRCDWTIPDLPARLAPFVATPKRARKGGRSPRPPAASPIRPPARAGGEPEPSSDDTIVAPPAPVRPRRR